MHVGAVEIRPFDPADARAVSTFIVQVFDEHADPGPEPGGMGRRWANITPQDVSRQAKTHTTFVAWQGSRPVGVIEVGKAGLVSMLFVHGRATEGPHGLGVAMALMVRAEEACNAAGQREIAVHSSPRAQSFYERLGFVAVDEPQVAQGLVFVPMAKKL
jgi:hypothetical protein